MRIGITVKDFKAITMHAESLKTSISARFSNPNRPMRLSYTEYGMQCDFTLMTIGEYRGPSVTPSIGTSRGPSAARSLQQPISQGQPSPSTAAERTSTMPPPVQPASRSFTREPSASQRQQRPSPPPPKSSLDPESLFIPQYEDEDRQWGEKPLDDEEDTVGWGASASAVNVS